MQQLNSPHVLLGVRFCCVQVEETFMQHVVRHWQGSLTEADSTAAMQADAEFSQADPSGVVNEASMGIGRHTREFGDAGERQQLLQQCCPCVYCFTLSVALCEALQVVGMLYSGVL